jgi:hypothetical protein
MANQPSFVALDYTAGLNIADGYLHAFVSNYRTKNSVGIFLIGHALELYSKSLYCFLEGNFPKKSHSILEILNSISTTKKTPALINLINEIKQASEFSFIDLIYKGHLADLKYINMKHNNIPELSFMDYTIFDNKLAILQRHLHVIFNILNKTIDNSGLLKLFIDDFHIRVEKAKNGLFENLYVGDSEIIVFLKKCFDINYQPITYSNFFGSITY